MFTFNEHLDNLIRHIDAVRNHCITLGKRLIADGRQEFGRLLIAKGFQHDASKFYGIEWDYLHVGPDVNPEPLKLSIRHHTLTNSHHPEYWGDINIMPELDLAELTCDWAARATEFGTDIRTWIRETGIKKYKVKKKTLLAIYKFVDKLFPNPFVKDLK